MVERALQKLAFADRAVELASVGVAADGHIDGAESVLVGILNFGGEQDRSSAGSESGLEAHELLQPFEAFFSQQFQEGAGFAAGDYQAIDLVELAGLFDEENFGAQLFEPAAVGVEIALQGQDSDFGSGAHFANSRREIP